jgi:hypothetical protein
VKWVRVDVVEMFDPVLVRAVTLTRSDGPISAISSARTTRMFTPIEPLSRFPRESLNAITDANNLPRLTHTSEEELLVTGSVEQKFSVEVVD